MPAHTPPAPPPGIGIHVQRQGWRHLKKWPDATSQLLQVEMEKALPGEKVEAQWVRQSDFLPLVHGREKQTVLQLGPKLMVVRFSSGLVACLSESVVPDMQIAALAIRRGNVHRDAGEVFWNKRREARAQGMSPVDAMVAGIHAAAKYSPTLRQIDEDIEMMSDQQFTAFTEMFRSSMEQMGKRIDDGNSNLGRRINELKTDLEKDIADLKTDIKEKPTKEYMLLGCGVIAFIAFMAGQAILHWKDILDFLH